MTPGARFPDEDNSPREAGWQEARSGCVADRVHHTDVPDPAGHARRREHPRPTARSGLARSGSIWVAHSGR